MRKVIFILVVALLASTAEAASNKSETETLRVVSEAKALFRRIIKDRREATGFPIAACGLDAAWGSYRSSPEFDALRDIAIKALGIDIGDHTGDPAPAVPPSLVLSGSGVPKDAFCDKAERDRRWQSLVDALKASLAAGKPQSIPDLSYDAYSFPLFSRDYTRAVVVEVGSGTPVRVDGRKLMFGPTEGAGYARVYFRNEAGWHQEDAVELYTAD